jgi:hypothetical protein
MPSTPSSSGISRRVLLSTLAALPILPAPFVPRPALAQAAADPLPSWNDGAAKQAIIAFVRDTTDISSAKFVTPEARIATFDQDGTLWVEHPMYTQVVYCLERVPTVVAHRPRVNAPLPKGGGFKLRLKAGSVRLWRTQTTLKSSSGSGGVWFWIYSFHTSSVTLPLLETQ